MTELLTSAQMRAIELVAIESGEITGLELMERAGQGVVEAIFEEWPELAGKEGEKEGGSAPQPAASPRDISGQMKKQVAPRRAVVLCGPGNNGGDGFVVARLLKARDWEVEVFLYGDVETLPPDAKQNCKRWLEFGSVLPLENNLETSTMEADLVVDALFGTGLSRPLLDLGQVLLDICEQRAVGSYTPAAQRRGASARVVAVDLPSGVCSDSGRALCEAGFKGLEQNVAATRAVEADLTVTFHGMKLGHVLGAGARYCGRTVVKPLAIDECHPTGGLVTLVECGRGQSLGKASQNHKYSHGHALVLSGGHGKTGAARLAARGALRIGAGLVTLGSPRSAMYENAAQLTAIMLHQIDGAHGVSELLEDERFNAICLGPGLGRGMDTQAVVIAALKARRATVLDADALTRFERDPQVLFDLLHQDCVLTPHGGEFAKLFPDLAAKLAAPALTGPAYSKVDATREAALRAGCVILFKGADTVIADPAGRCSVNSAHYERAAPWLATAGSGDVLAGIITGLMARGVSPMQAAEMGTWLHVESARTFGPGLISEDLPEQIPAVLRRLEPEG
ncbi:NAD(P)H-hydrate dehydratase [Pseudophaeobacter sp.]|uniref:NAD(P)H-hydrate dehydratase n=1 Tax=Pseudophaeobacter sp. TaxID=1971739 RepID=UPI003296B945